MKMDVPPTHVPHANQAADGSILSLPPVARISQARRERMGRRFGS